MLEALGLCRREGERMRLAPLDFHFLPGRVYGIIGPNGAGKSTLLTLLSGQMPPSSGQIFFAGRPLTEYSLDQRARAIAWLPQQERQDLPLRVDEFVRLGTWPADDSLRTQKALTLAGLDALASRPIRELSGGEFRRAGLARILAQESRLALLDELDQGLDPAHRQHCLSLVRDKLGREGRTAIVVLHDVQSAAVFCDELLLLARGGRLLAAGTPREVLTKPKLDALYMADLFVEDSCLGGSLLISTPPAVTGDELLRGRSFHLVCGGGSGGAMLAMLAREGAKLSAGVLNVGDRDWKAATQLGVDLVTIDPFTAIGEEARRSNRRRMEAADEVIACGFPVGPGNLANLEELHSFLRRHPGRLTIVAADQFSDHTGGQAAPLLDRLRAHPLQFADPASWLNSQTSPPRDSFPAQ